MKARILTVMAIAVLLSACGTVPQETAEAVSQEEETVPGQETEETIIPNEGKKEVTGGLRSYSELPDGTFECEGHNYKYRLEISGRMSKAAKRSTFIYLSNIEEISFERATMAAGLSSNMDDYFSPEEAVLVGWILE